jgi:glucose-1-phosphate adenylyltransferase
MMRDCVALVLAGGKGSRLDPLTRDRAKPAVPFGGAYRIIDFVLSNCLNSHLRRILVLTQYKAMSLDRHINLGWRRYFCHELDEFLDIVPPQQRFHEHWYQGTADAVYQNIYAIEKERPRHVVILAGDHIYKMDYMRMMQFHLDSDAVLTIGTLPVLLQDGKQFGVIQMTPDHRVTGFQEKPASPTSMPGDPSRCLASMGIYVFDALALYEQLMEDANDPQSNHDFGRDIVPKMVKHGSRVFAFPFRDENRKHDAYWRDVGTLDAYYEASMDLVSVDPLLNLYDEDWPIRSYQPNLPPPKFVFDSEGKDHSIGRAVDSVVCLGTIVSGGFVRHSILGANVRVNRHAVVQDSLLFHGVDVGEHAMVRRAIVDKDVRIPPGFTVGYDLTQDREHGFTISDSGIVVVPAGWGGTR